MEQNQQGKLSTDEKKRGTKRKYQSVSTKNQDIGEIKKRDDTSDGKNEVLSVRILSKLLFVFHFLVKYSFTLNLYRLFRISRILKAFSISLLFFHNHTIDIIYRRSTSSDYG